MKRSTALNTKNGLAMAFRDKVTRMMTEKTKVGREKKSSWNTVAARARTDIASGEMESTCCSIRRDSHLNTFKLFDYFTLTTLILVRYRFYPVS
jgi:hypothetical protein